MFVDICSYSIVAGILILLKQKLRKIFKKDFHKT